MGHMITKARPTTLLSVMGLMNSCTEGKYFLNGAEVIGLSQAEQARVQMAAMQLGDVMPLSRGEIDARNAGYKPHSPETWRAWEYWATRAGCAELLQKR
jgi:hypothetical protein